MSVAVPSALAASDLHWHRHVPLGIKSVDAEGKVSVDRTIVLTEREADISLDTSRPFKLNAGTTGVCE